VSGSDREAYSVAALAYALNDDTDNAERMLNEVEKDIVRIDKVRKCYKLSKSQTTCHLRHTSYAAIAYLTLKRIEPVKAIISWILTQYRVINYFYYTYDVAINTEAISKFLVARQVALTSDLEFTFTNELDFRKVLHIKPANQKDTQEVVFPEYTLYPKVEVKGQGYCSVSYIVESTVALKKSNPKFKLTVKAPSATGTSRTVTVCATYQPQEEEVSAQTLFNVIYDIEMPSGFTFTEVVNLASKPEIKMVHPRLQRSRVQIYYNDFEKEKNYCVDIKATKFFDVKDMQSSGVMVYDYNDKDNIAIDFYKFSNNC
jgi:hypothetical protein